MDSFYSNTQDVRGIISSYMTWFKCQNAGCPKFVPFINKTNFCDECCHVCNGFRSRHSMVCRGAPGACHECGRHARSGSHSYLCKSAPGLCHECGRRDGAHKYHCMKRYDLNWDALCWASTNATPYKNDKLQINSNSAK